jgi:hypothetical protein
MTPTPERCELLLARLTSHLEERYRVAVEVVDIPPPFLGDLDGAEIRLQPRHDPRAALFTLSHLFGHTVQWNLSARARAIGAKADGGYTAAELAEIETYERDASRYGLRALHEIGAGDLDPWISDFAAADLGYLKHFYATGERRPLADFWRDGQPRLEPLPIPAFTPRRFKFRWEGVVV